MTTFQLLNFGCRASQADGAALKKQLLDAGLEEAANPTESRITVLNTCTVTAGADAEVRQVIRRIHRANPGCRILVTGCYAQRAPQEIAQLPGVAWVVGNSHKHAVASILGAEAAATPRRAGREAGEGNAARGPVEPQAGPPTLVHIQPFGAGGGATNGSRSLHQTQSSAEETRAAVLVGEISEDFHFTPVFPDDRTRPTLKVQDGCNAACAFCIIPSVRGPSRSLAPERVIEEVRELVGAGFREVVLSGINLGSYGRDLGRRITFLRLIERILAETSIERIRISSIEPMDVSPDLIHLAATEPRLARHFHVPLQSGCDRILRLMNRRYWARQYAERILAIREAMPNCGIGADVMVGFPTETGRDHQANVRFIESLPFTYLHLFPYSSRPMTAAASFPAQVDGRLSRERSKEIRSVMATKRRGFLEGQFGRTLSALTMDESADGARLALTTNYLKVALPGSAIPRNTFADIRIGRVCGDLLYGYPSA